ncbi:IS3 family transposase [Limosilactobacillus coleohominis]
MRINNGSLSTGVGRDPYYNQYRIRHKLKGKTPIEYRNLALEKVG